MIPPLTDRQLSWLRTFRGYTEDEAQLAAMAADEIVALRAAAKELHKLLTTYAIPTLDGLVVNRNYYAEDIIASVVTDIEAAAGKLAAALPHVADPPPKESR